MRKHHALALLALAAAPAARAVTSYNTLVYPLVATGETIQIPGTYAPQVAVASQAVGEGSGTPTGGNDHALLWTAVSPTPVDLNGSSGPLTSSVAYGTDGANQVGSGSGSLTGGIGHALLWSGTAASVVDLNPTDLTGITNSTAYGVSGKQQVGYGVSGNNFPSGCHALVWNGSGSSAVDLTPTNMGTLYGTFAEATDGIHQVGGTIYSSSNSYDNRALLWSGNASSAIDLTPIDYPLLVNSYAYGVSGNQQVGLAYVAVSNDPFNITQMSNAMLWNGSGASAVDLSPSLPGITGTQAFGTNGSQQVGLGETSNGSHGIVWTGTAASAQDLHGYLPSTGTWSSSIANSIDSSGDIFGTAVGALNGISATFAAEWIPANSSDPIVVASGQNYQFAGNSAAGISNRSIGGLTINGGGAAIIPASANSSTRQVLVITGTGLAIAGTTGNWTGSLNLANNDLDLPGASLATVSDQVKQGYNGGTWNGSDGIASTAAAADTKHLTALGVIQNNQSGFALFTASHQFDGVTPGTTDVLVKYTYDGDTNFDGQVDGSDYANIDNGYLHKLTGWFNGDFNYDGTVNGSDYTLIDNSFNQQGAAISAAVATSTAQVGGATNVPEPGMGAVLVAGMLLARRRSTFRFSSGRPESTPSAMAGDTGDTGETVPLRGDR